MSINPIRGDVYEGSFKNMLRHGKGRLFIEEQDFEVVGQFYEDKAHGLCTIRHDGSIFEGTVEEGIPVEGVVEYFDGMEYEGNVDGELTPHGEYGKLTLPGDSVSEGSWLNGVLSGYGKITRQDNRIAEGEFEDGK